MKTTLPTNFLEILSAKYPTRFRNKTHYRTAFRTSLGSEFLFSWSGSAYKRVRLIKVTPKGYNLLDLESNNCILKTHMYHSEYFGPIEMGLNFNLSSDAKLTSLPCE